MAGYPASESSPSSTNEYFLYDMFQGDKTEVTFL